jgi:hypothetical protein
MSRFCLSLPPHGKTKWMLINNPTNRKLSIMTSFFVWGNVYVIAFCFANEEEGLNCKRNRSLSSRSCFFPVMSKQPPGKYYNNERLLVLIFNTAMKFEAFSCRHYLFESIFSCYQTSEHCFMGSWSYISHEVPSQTLATKPVLFLLG